MSLISNESFVTNITTFFSFYEDFCVKKLKFCCPGRDEFGKKCKKCPVDADGKVCSGNGICVGAGDKEGIGGCKCNDHFAGWKCHECHEDYFMSKGECHKCHKSCKVSLTTFFLDKKIKF